MRVRKSKSADLERMLEIYTYARAFMKANGNPTQWGDSYPEKCLLEEDIRQGDSYVIEDEEGIIRGTFKLLIGDDPTYSYIEDGEWPNDEPYGTIHRAASDGQRKGITEIAVKFSQTICDNIRIDTHHDNTVMQKAVEKLGFRRCGIIYVEDGSPRIAYQL